MNKPMTINEFLAKWKKSSIEERKELSYNYWYDWFCSTTSLYNRTLKFIPMLKNLIKLKPEIGACRFDGKNCCPFNGPLYDVLRIWNNKNQLVVGIEFDERYEKRFCVFNQGSQDFKTDDRKEAVQLMSKNCTNLG